MEAIGMSCNVKVISISEKKNTIYTSGETPCRVERQFLGTGRERKFLKTLLMKQRKSRKWKADSLHLTNASWHPKERLAVP